jgi:hypothetical protein
VSHLTPASITPSLRSCLAYAGVHRDRRPRGDCIVSALRSADLKKLAEQILPEGCHSSFSSDLWSGMTAFVESRERLAGRIAPDVVLRELHRPRSLLLTDWSSSLFDGALMPETDGFLNEEALPPWDTWLTLVETPDIPPRHCLVSWVPEWISAQVDRAIQIDAAECLSWLKPAGNGFQTLGWGRAWE